MNLFGTLLVTLIALIVVNRAYGAQVYDTINAAFAWLAGTLVLGAILGSSVAVVFNYGEEKKKTIKRALISFIFSISTTPFLVDYFDLTGSFTAYWFFAFMSGVLGFVAIEVLYSETFRAYIQAALTRGRNK